jgi:hypothetical protein
MAEHTQESILKRIAKMESMLKNFRIIGAGVEIQGNLAKGYSMNASFGEAGGGGGGAVPPRCSDADCANWPTTMSLALTISGNVETSVDCNEEEPYELSSSGSTGVIDVTDQDDPLGCSEYSVGKEDIPFSYTCINPACSGSFTYQISAILECTGGDPDFTWTLTLGLDGFGSICSDFPLGGLELVIMDLGANPIGTHNISLDDPNISTVHYDFTLIVT